LRQAADHVLLRNKAHLVRFCFVPIEEPGAHLQLVAWLAGQWEPKVVIHRVGLRQRKVNRTGFGAWVIRQKVARVRIFPAPIGFVLDAISVTEQDLRRESVSEKNNNTFCLWRERN
jgi:hypothetical protein